MCYNWQTRRQIGEISAFLLSFPPPYLSPPDDLESYIGIIFVRSYRVQLRLDVYRH